MCCDLCRVTRIDESACALACTITSRAGTLLELQRPCEPRVITVARPSSLVRRSLQSAATPQRNACQGRIGLLGLGLGGLIGTITTGTTSGNHCPGLSQRMCTATIKAVLAANPQPGPPPSAQHLHTFQLGCRMVIAVIMLALLDWLSRLFVRLSATCLDIAERGGRVRPSASRGQLDTTKRRAGAKATRSARPAPRCRCCRALNLQHLRGQPRSSNSGSEPPLLKSQAVACSLQPVIAIICSRHCHMSGVLAVCGSLVEQLPLLVQTRISRDRRHARAVDLLRADCDVADRRHAVVYFGGFYFRFSRRLARPASPSAMSTSSSPSPSSSCAGTMPRIVRMRDYRERVSLEGHEGLTQSPALTTTAATRQTHTACSSSHGSIFTHIVTFVVCARPMPSQRAS